jgi:hypothetical protein
LPAVVIPWTLNKGSLIVRILSAHLLEPAASIDTNQITLKFGIFTGNKHTENAEAFVK